MSRLSARIMAIMLFPLAVFLVGLLSIDQYRTTLIMSEFTALERQGFTLARSLALAEAELDVGIARRKLSRRTMQHLIPLVGFGSELRARVFQPNGTLLADTVRRGSARVQTNLRRRDGEPWRMRMKRRIHRMMTHVTAMMSNPHELPLYAEQVKQQASHYREVQSALRGEPMRMLRLDRRSNMVLSVAVPIQDVRLVRGALLVSIGGGKIEKELADVHIVFLELFIAVLLVTIGLSVYLARSITTPITQLANAAENLRRSSNLSARLQRLPERKDEIGQLSESFINLTDELQKRMQATAGFAADVAHELKNPLSSLRSAAETISRISDPVQQQKLMNVILQDVERLNRLITDISQASRVDTEIADEQGHEVNITELVENFVQMRRQSFADNKIHLDIYDAPLIARIHEGRIVQVIDNVLANAVSFSPPKGKIFVTVKPVAADKVAISIQDQGQGIPENRLEAVFERFYSERPSGEAFGEHSGLGLSIARQIAEAHGGTLTAKNNDKVGACFALTLPLI
jgi:two-component system sensor histidine kinase ChvG